MSSTAHSPPTERAPGQETGTGTSRRGRPIELGGALVTLVEPHAGHEVAYNRWYERDHFYAGCMIGAWTLAGARYVATRDLKVLRYPEGSPICPDLTSGSYLSLYWVLAGRFGDWITWATQQVRWLHDEDRMFPHRDHVHTKMYRFRAEHPGGDDAVPAELALDHRSPYVVMTVAQPAPGVEDEDLDAFFAEHAHPHEVGVTFRPVPMPDDAPSDVPRDVDESTVIGLWFVDDDLPARWDEGFASLGDRFAAAGLGEVTFASPFRATVPGTDTYTDQL